ncbi:MAG: hypothetical protein ACOCVU_00395 [Desulfohalobiaceae bacterium]
MITKLLILAAGVVVVFVIASILMSKKKKEDGGQGEEYTIANYKSGKNYKVRNMIILSLLLVAVGTWWFLSNRSLQNKQEALSARKQVLTAREDSTRVQTLRKDDVEERLLQIKWEDELNNKVMMRDDSSTRSLEYFFELADRYATYLHFDFGHSESGVAEGDSLVKYNEYIITGKAFMNQIYAFIDQLERQALSRERALEEGLLRVEQSILAGTGPLLDYSLRDQDGTLVLRQIWNGELPFWLHEATENRRSWLLP